MEIYTYVGLWGFVSRCGVEIVRHDTGGATVIFTELQDNPGTPVKNLVSALATRVRMDRLADLAPEKIRWIEHHPAHGARAATYDEVLLEWDRLDHAWNFDRSGAHRRWLTADEIRQLGFEPDEVELVAGELVRRGISCEHEGGDVRIDGYAVSRHELRALVNAAHGNVDDFLRRFAKMRELFV